MISDADIEQAELAAIGSRAHALWERGICAHMGWQTYCGPETTPHLEPGEAICLDCGKRFASRAELIAETDELIS